MPPTGALFESLITTPAMEPPGIQLKVIATSIVAFGNIYTYGTIAINRSSSTIPPLIDIIETITARTGLQVNASSGKTINGEIAVCIRMISAQPSTAAGRRKRMHPQAFNGIWVPIENPTRDAAT